MLSWPRVGPWLLAAAWSFAKQGVSQSVPPPNVDFSSLGQVAVAGSFDAISVYQSVGQNEGYINNGTQSVLARLPSGFYEKLASTDASIEAMCPFVLRNGTFVGVMVGGNFTSIGGVDTRSVALIDPNTFAITPQVGIQGIVTTLLCDNDTETVYVGGTFEASTSKNAITWVAAGSWANLPFSGFDAPVTSIVRAPSGNIVFGGSFSGLGNTTATSNSSALESNQVINLNTATITSTGNVTSGNSITCPPTAAQSSTSPWLLQDNTAGSWQASLRYGFQPTRLRLWNTHQDGRGTKTWRLTALPDGGIMNFTYTNPDTGRLEACDATCPLSSNTSVQYQDFDFVNLVGMNSIRIDVSEWYGSGAGLDGVELFQTDIFAYAIEAFNEPSCSGSSTLSTASTTGSWYNTPSGESNTDYLTVVTGPTTVGSTDIVFQPDVKESGNYSVIVYTPGCQQDSSCSARATVNVTGTLTTSGANTFTTFVSQTNNFDKYDQVYQGYIDAATSSFRPSVTIRPSGLQTDQLVVASRIRFAFVNSTGGLNGLFEFDPNSAVVNTNFSQSAINSAGTRLRPNAHVVSLATHDDVIYSAGSFSDDSFDNIMSFANNTASSLPQGGLNAAVTDMYAGDQYLYVAGNFTATNQEGGPAGLSNVAAFEYSSNQWVSLGAGLDGPVQHVSPMPLNVTSSGSEMVIAFSGDFRNILATGSGSSIPVNGFAIWVPSQKTWYQGLTGITKEALVGQLYAYAILPNNTWVGAGTLASLGYEITDAASLQSAPAGRAQVQQLPINISVSTTSATNSLLTKRALGDSPDFTGVTTGLYYIPNDNNNVTILGGHFNATGTNSTVINNLLFVNASNNNEVTGLPAGIDANSTFLALATQNTLLIAAGNVTGTVGDAAISGVVMYDFSSGSYRPIQPAALASSTENPVAVRAIAPQPSTSSIYVGGSFVGTASGLACRSVCAYDTSSNQWNTVGGQLDGSVVGLFWSSTTQLIAAGNLSVSGNATGLATYDVKQQTWSIMSNVGNLGSVTAFTPGTDDGKRVWIAGTANNGSTFLVLDDSNNLKTIVGYFNSGTNIADIQVVPIKSKASNRDYLNENQSLLITGQLNMTGYGEVSAALFDGHSMTPFMLASNADGTVGSVSQIFTSKTMSLPSTGK